MKAPSYQIDCQMTKKGKMFSGSKQRVKWSFGFANHEALQNGQSGIACRGEEHEVVMVWSLTSGKRFVLADGHEVHWSKSSKRIFAKFECHWQMASGHKLSVIAHASTPLFDKNKEGFRQFDLQIDGVSFWDLPQMYELGCSNDSGNQVLPIVSSTNNSIYQVPRFDYETPQQQQQQDIPKMIMEDQCSVVSDVQASYYRNLPQLSGLDNVSLTPHTISPSPSMPDLFDLATPSSSYNDSMMASLHGSNNLHNHSVGSTSSQMLPLRPIATSSPTSVMINPFDIYAHASHTMQSQNQSKSFSNEQQHMANDILAHYAPSLTSPLSFQDSWSTPRYQQQQQEPATNLYYATPTSTATSLPQPQHAHTIHAGH